MPKRITLLHPHKALMESNSPILSREEFPRFTFSTRPTIEPNVAIVLFGENGELTALMPGQRLTSGEIFWKNYKGFYRIDMGIHGLEFHLKAPCNKDAFDFDVTVNAVYRVDNPIEVVRSQVQDVQILLKPEITKRIRMISRKFGIEQSEDIEREINAIFEKGIQISGIFVSQIVASVELESESREHLRHVQSIKNEIVKQEVFHELEILKSKHEIELKKLKLEFYAPLIKKGHWDLLALQLTEHPDDVSTIANMVVQLRQAELDVQLDLLKSMLEDGVLEGFQIEEAGKQELLLLLDNLDSNSGNKTDLIVDGDLVTGDENKVDLPPEKQETKNEYPIGGQDIVESAVGKDSIVIVSEPPTPPKDNSDLQSDLSEKNYKVSISFPLLLSKRFDSVFLFQLYLPEQRSRVSRNIKAQFLEKPREYVDQSIIKFGQKIQVEFYSSHIDFSKPVIKLVDGTLTKIVFLGSPRDTCQTGTQNVRVSISDVETQQEIESFNLEVRVVDFAFDHISRPLLSRVSAVVLGIGSFTMFLLTLLEQIDKTVGLTSGTAAGVLAAVVYANFYNLYQRIRPSSP